MDFLKARESKAEEGTTSSNTPSNGLAEPWIFQWKEPFDPQHEMRQRSTNVSIFRVPQPIMISKPEAYVPLVVSLGPYHHKKNPKLSAMEESKLEAVHRTVARLKKWTFNQLVNKIIRLETLIRDCYEDSAIESNARVLAGIFVTDACFILEYISSYVEMTRSDINSFNPVFQSCAHHNELHSSIQNDIWKLENQIPLFVLITILQLEFPSREDAVLVLATMLSRFIMYRGFPFSLESWTAEKIQSILKQHIDKGASHVLDLYRRVIKNYLTNSSSEPAPDVAINLDDSPGSDGGPERRTSWCCSINPIVDDRRSTPRAELLGKAGIKFKSGKFRFKNRMFAGSTLSIPKIRVDNETERVLRNLMAFEECQRGSSSPEETLISQYMHLMDDLIDCEQDVALLKKEGIILSGLGSDTEIADMFNSICNGITETEFEPLEFVMREARKHYNSQAKVWISQFRKENCSKPWYVVSGVAGMLILVMTAIQTVYTLKK